MGFRSYTMGICDFDFPETVLPSKHPPIILASESPRRKLLLGKMGVEFTVSPSRIAELPPMGELPNTYVTRLALEKAVSVAQNEPGAVVIGADTVVAVDDRILGKPSSRQEAQLMLSLLSGRWHDVWTGVCVLYNPQRFQELIAAKSSVLFRDVTVEEIENYVAGGEPMDKAGAYAIQGKARRFVKQIKGSYHNIVGLPTLELGKILTKLEIPFDSNSMGVTI